MPSIELVSVGQPRPPVLPALPFAVIHGPELRSHRGPRPLFQADFDGVRGWMYHLGNPSCGERQDGAFFAYDLLSRRSQDGEGGGLLEFAPEFRPAVEFLLGLLLSWSPEGLVLFTSDWQFGPETAVRSGRLRVDEFWRRHAAGQLRINALYPVTRPTEAGAAPDAVGG